MPPLNQGQNLWYSMADMPSTTINCPHCHKPIAIEEVLKHQVEEQLLAGERKKHEEEITVLREQILKDAKKQAASEFELSIKTSEEEKKDITDRNRKLQDQTLDLSKQVRSLLEKQEDLKLEHEKRLTQQLEEERKKIREKVEAVMIEEQRQKEMEKDKMISDLRKALDDAKRKADQGSQQTQGEVVELQLEETLRTNFPQDVIEPIGKGIHGADIRHIVKSPGGTTCGVILWESKQTKRFDEKWIGKLKQDMRDEKADIPALVSSAFTDGAWNGLTHKDGVWVCSFSLVLSLALLLRKTLLDVGYQKAVNQHQGKKADLIYDYITGHEFRQQIESLVEVFSEMQQQIVRERTAFEKSWKQREGQLQRLYSSTANVYGSLQGRGGNAVPEIRGLELLTLEEGK